MPQNEDGSSNERHNTRQSNAEIDELKRQLRTARAEKEDARKQLVGMKAEKLDVVQQLIAATAEKKRLETSCKALQDKEQEDENEKEELRKERDELQNENDKLDAAARGAEEQLASVVKERDCTQDISYWKQAAESANTRASEAESTLERTERELERRNRELVAEKSKLVEEKRRNAQALGRKLGSDPERLYKQHELLWMELCRRWENSVPLESWRARVVSGKALFRLLHSFSKLVGAWVHAHIPSNPRGSLIYIKWGPDGLEGWRVNQLRQDASDITFMKVFDVQGNPDGSHRLEPAQLGEPSLQSDIRLHKDGNQNGLSVYEIVDAVEDAFDEADTELAFVVDPPLPAEVQWDLVMPAVICGRPTTRRGPAHAVYPLLLSDDELLLGTQGRVQMQGEDSEAVYKRLKVAVPTSGQDLAGLWTGCYGGHGWEILNLTYTSDGSIIGTKVTGDPNVPSGVISFRTNLGKQSENACDFGFSADDNDMAEWTRYAGQGRLAEQVFQNPNWVDGMFSVGSNGNIRFDWRTCSGVSYKRVSLEEAFKERSERTKWHSS